MMSLRVICFVAAVFLTGAWRWLAVAGAAFLPAIAVVIANAIDLRRKQGGEVPTVTPQPVDLPELEAAREQPLVIPAEPADGAPDDPAPPKAQRPGT